MVREEGLNPEFVLIVGTLAMISMAFAIVFFIYMYQRKLIKRKKENQEIQDLLQEQEMKATYALLEGQDKERKRIAAELHDNLGSILVTLNMYADALSIKKKPEQIKDISEKIGDTTRAANTLVRDISHSLDSGLLKHFGLESAIIQLMEAVSLSKKIKTTSEINIPEGTNSDTGLQLYRVVQELLNNSLKHSKCTSIRLDISKTNDEISFIYEDNGVGFDVEAISRGMGLNNLESRVENLGGHLEIESEIGKGSTFIFEISTK